MTKQEMIEKVMKFNGSLEAQGYRGNFKLNIWEKGEKTRIYVNWKEPVGYFTIDANDTNPRRQNFFEVNGTGIYAQGNRPGHTTILRYIIENC